MANQNCWEFKRCGREPGGSKVSELGVCVAAADHHANGFLGGTNAGRACAYVAGTLCGGEVQGEYAQKIRACFDCDFYRALQKEHGGDFNAMSFIRFTKKKLAS